MSCFQARLEYYLHIQKPPYFINIGKISKIIRNYSLKFSEAFFKKHKRIVVKY